MKTKITGLVIVLLLALSGSTCRKKIEKFPFEMSGIWYAPDMFCPTVLVIEKNSTGKMFTLGSFCVTSDLHLNGKIKYKKDVLYVDGKKFDIFQEPVLVTEDDSISAPDENDLTGNYVTRKILAKMTLNQKGIFKAKDSHKFYKYVNY